MPGFPTRTGRSGFGPDPLNSTFVRDPRKQLDGETIGRLMLWQLGGAGLLLPQCHFSGEYSGGAWVLDTHAEAFQPNGGAGPTIARTSAGVYTFAYAATYPDETGEAKPLVLRGGMANPNGAAVFHGWVALNADKHSGTAYFWSIQGSTLADPAALFVVLW